jgi:hypothetical protein
VASPAAGVSKVRQCPEAVPPAPGSGQRIGRSVIKGIFFLHGRRMLSAVAQGRRGGAYSSVAQASARTRPCGRVDAQTPGREAGRSRYASASRHEDGAYQRGQLVRPASQRPRRLLLTLAGELVERCRTPALEGVVEPARRSRRRVRGTASSAAPAGRPPPRPSGRTELTDEAGHAARAAAAAVSLTSRGPSDPTPRRSTTTSPQP